MIEALRGVETGTYFHPWPRASASEQEALLRAHRAGPFFELRYVAEGVDPQSPQKLLLGSLHHLAVALIAALALRWLTPALASYGARFLVLALAGVLATLHLELGDPIWFHLPSGYAIARAVYGLGGFLTLAAILAALPPTTRARGM